MMNVIESYFHTPKLPDPIHLDLAELRGGGFCPSQFYGKTRDDLDVYARYRGGHLYVKLGYEAGDDAYRDGFKILDANIGPPGDGTMSLPQFCHCTGSTVDGTVPEELGRDFHRCRDLSGATSFWGARVRYLTPKTSRKILAAWHAALPDALLVEPVRSEGTGFQGLRETTFEEARASSLWLVSGASRVRDIPICPDFYVRPKPGQLQVSLHYGLWDSSSRLRKTWDYQTACQDTGQALLVAGQPDMPEDATLPYEDMIMSTEFPSDHKMHQRRLTRLMERIRSMLQETKLEQVELTSGNTVAHLTCPLDPELRKWCAQGPDRWISLRKENRNAPWTGIRPVRD